jgi:hypothetical protein
VRAWTTCDDDQDRRPEDSMTDPQGSDRIQQDIPTSSATGDESSVGLSFEDVALTREEALERDAANGDDLPARAVGDVALSQRADPPGGA